MTNHPNRSREIREQRKEFISAFRAIFPYLARDAFNNYPLDGSMVMGEAWADLERLAPVNRAQLIDAFKQAAQNKEITSVKLP
jgi:hypothetical protein